MQIMSVINSKGGVGKTTVKVGLASKLAGRVRSKARCVGPCFEFIRRCVLNQTLYEMRLS